MNAHTETPVKTSTQLRRLLSSPGLIKGVNIYDPLTARIAEEVGFRFIAMGGWQVGAQLCVTEPLLTMTEAIECARLVTKAVNIPLKVDCGGGFGEPIHVARTVREAEDANIACIHLEDQYLPKRASYHRGVEEVIPTEAMVDKITIAVESKRDKDLVIVGRTDSLLTHGLAEAIKRGNSYLEAGCDVVEVFPNSVEEAKQIAKEIHGPLLHVNISGNHGDLGRPNFRWAELEDMGFKICIDATTVILLAMQSVRKGLIHYLEEGFPPPNVATDRETMKYIERVIGLPELYEIEARTVFRNQAEPRDNKRD
ncbi:MAG TPA: isocitrate lyase/PEP mutase family protein [Candidatus Acidoferrales bacterium]|jgi:methylisocitrate lyase|nr:isocitrate lyase/PEP mutase family protein [Candidatus Acidoferrales bacterium]